MEIINLIEYLEIKIMELISIILIIFLVLFIIILFLIKILIKKKMIINIKKLDKDLQVFFAKKGLYLNLIWKKIKIELIMRIILVIN